MSQNHPINNQVCSSTFINVMDVKENQKEEEVAMEMEMEMENRSDQQQQQVIEEDDESLELSLSIRPTLKKKMKMSTPAFFPPPPTASSSSQPNNNSHEYHDLFAAAAAAFHVNQLNYTVLNTGNYQDGPIMHLGPLFAAQSLEPPPPPPHHHIPIRPHASYYAPAPAPAVIHHDQQPAQRHQPHVPPVVQRAAQRNRRIRSPGPNENNEVFPPPFPWATDRFAKILTYEEIIARGIYEITGEVQCKKCEHKVMIGFDFKTKFDKVGRFVFEYKYILKDRASPHWNQIEYPSCPNCDQPNSLKPVIPDDQKMINWLFLLLGEMIGSCTLDDLRFYCKHTGHHRTGAKDRLIYLTYLGLCHQLDPSGPFEYHPPGLD